MLILIVIYLLYRNKCKCKWKTTDGSVSEEEYDMEFWLNHVDKQKLERKNVYYALFNPTLPEACSDSREATAAWVIEHRKMWTNLHKHDFKSFTISSPINTKLQKGSNKMPTKLDKNDKSFWTRSKFLMDHFKKLNLLKSVNNKNKSNYNKTQLLQELECQTQLLIDYARIDAITHNTFNKSPNIMNQTSSIYLNSGNGSKQQTANRKRSQLDVLDLDVNDNIVNQASCSSLVVDNINNIVSSTVSGGDIDGQFVIDSDSLNRKKQKYLLTEKFIKNYYRRRSNSWPRCRYDNRSHMSNYERLIKLNYLKLIYDNDATKNNRTIKETEKLDQTQCIHTLVKRDSIIDKTSVVNLFSKKKAIFQIKN